ncbi:Uncharacterized protein PCOAH_00030360 [Plasmodium coatneyi]|uniref:Uncharacterized protein n=1 Tax=Plasmodium coatneyi TaxID=208452 RepID=A0A1B1E1A9_9APIC|nr:Uncharacterized protein PCOAH_00030360 [Plasmodium coatneyi]ANQ08647.1 Uncharacterized protein PCOAH_00030360 [Plasmodium coatneyi]
MAAYHPLCPLLQRGVIAGQVKKRGDQFHRAFVISSRVGGTKKQKKLSSKTAKHINYVFEKKKKADEERSFNIIKRRKLKDVPSSQFHFICHLKHGEVQSAQRGSVSLLRGALPPSGQAQLPWGEITPNGEATIGEDDPIGELLPIGENSTTVKNSTAEEAFRFFPRGTIRQDRREKDLKNATALSSIVHLGRNKDICNTYLRASLMNIYHEENHNHAILKMMKELQRTHSYMNSRQVSLIIYNLYQYFFIQVVKQIYGKDNPSNYEWYLRLFYVVDDGFFVTPPNKGETYQSDMPVDNSLMRNLLITLWRNVKTHMHCEDDLNTLNRIAFVYSYFSVKDNALMELLIRKIFQCMDMKKNKNIKYFSLAALALEKWELYSVKFMHAYSSLVTKTIDKLTKKGEDLLINRKKKKKKTKLKHVNLFDVHKKEKKKLPLISLKDILTYLYVLNRNDVKDNHFVERILRYASLFWRDDCRPQACNPGECVSLSVNKKKESFNADTVSQKNMLLTSPAFRSALYANRKRHKNRSNMLTLYALYRISKRAARRRETPLSCFANRVWLHGNGEEGGESNLPMRKEPVQLSISSWKNGPCDNTPNENRSAFSPADYGPESTVFINKQRTWVSFYKKEVIPMAIFLHHLTQYDYAFLKKKDDFLKLTKLYRDVLLKSDLTNLHFFYTHKIVSVVRDADICSNFLTTLYTSALHKCRRYISLKNAGVLSDVCAQNVCAYVVILYIQVLKNKIKDDPLTEALSEFLVKFFSTCRPEQVTPQFLIPPLKLLSMLNSPREDNRYVVPKTVDITNGVTNKGNNVDELPSCNTNDQIDEQQNNVKSNGQQNALPSRKTNLQLLNVAILTILKGLNWNNVDNFFLLKSYKYMNRLAGQKKKAKFCMNMVRQKNHSLCSKITHTVKEKMSGFNCEELMKVYLYSGNNFKRRTILLRNLFTNLLLSNGGIVHRGDNNFFMLFFKTALTHLHLNEVGKKKKRNIYFFKNSNDVMNKLMVLSRTYICTHVDSMRRKHVYSLIMHSLLYLYSLLQKGKNEMNYHSMKGNPIARILVDIASTTLKRWTFMNDERSLLIYVCLLCFRNMARKNKKIKNIFFNKNDDKHFVGNLLKVYAEQVEQICLSEFDRPATTYTNPLLLFLLLKHKIVLRHHRSRKDMRIVQRLVGSGTPLHRLILNTASDTQLMQVILYAITKNYSILMEEDLLDDLHLRTSTVQEEPTRNSTTSPSHLSTQNNPGDVSEWVELIKRMSTCEDHHLDKSILCNFVARKKSVEQAIKVALSMNVSETFCW